MPEHRAQSPDACCAAFQRAARTSALDDARDIAVGAAATFRRWCGTVLLTTLVVCSAPDAARAADSATSDDSGGEPHRTLTRAYLEEKYASSDSRFALVDDARIHYKDAGHGPAILLIHGSLGDTDDWDGWVESLKSRYRVIRMDLPGFGLSGEIANGNYSVDHSLALIDGLMDSLGLERFAIVGVSFGGPVAFRYAATRTERITALIIMNSAGIELGKQQIDPKTGKKDYFRNVTSDAPLSREYMEHSLDRVFSDPAHIPPGMVERKLDFVNAIGREREGAQIIGQFVRGDPERVLAHIRAPTLVLWGASERSLSLETADRFAAALTHARLVRKILVPHGDHAMHIEFPQETVRLAENFLDSIRPPR